MSWCDGRPVTGRAEGPGQADRVKTTKPPPHLLIRSFRSFAAYADPDASSVGT